jgi:hypothetical protein
MTTQQKLAIGIEALRDIRDTLGHIHVELPPSYHIDPVMRAVLVELVTRYELIAREALAAMEGEERWKGSSKVGSSITY